MGIRVEPYTDAHVPAVLAFNTRLRRGSWQQFFPEHSQSRWLPPGGHPTLFNEQFVAVDDAGEVRGGYILKHQEFVVGGERRAIANYAFPLSEGVTDRRYGMVGVQMILDAQKRNARLYGLGMGSLEHPSVRVMKGVGWSAELVPFLFRILRPYRFLREIEHLRRSPARRLALDAAAFSGAGSLAIKAIGLRGSRARRASGPAEQVGRFGAWADEVWASVVKREGLMAVRDAEALNAIYPSDADRFKIFTVRQGAAVAGWVVCLATQMRDSGYFGNMKVGSVVDCLARPGCEATVVAAADRELEGLNCDLIVTNQSSAAWCRAFNRAGYWGGPSNFALTVSRQLAEDLGSLAAALPLSHVNRGDGDGPIHL